MDGMDSKQVTRDSDLDLTHLTDHVLAARGRSLLNCCAYSTVGYLRRDSRTAVEHRIDRSNIAGTKTKKVVSFQSN
jgi:hypothetical protein